MIFWFLAALLTLAAALAVMSPFFRADGTAARRELHDIEVYRDQLRELEREVARGLAAPDEAAEARAEIGRRILRAQDALNGAGAGGDGRRLTRAFAAAAVLSVPIVSWGLYTAIGSPGVPAEPLQARLSKDPEDSSIDELVARAESHLASNPDDGRGWEVLGPVYFRMGRFEDSATAYRNAIRTLGSSAERQAALGEAIAGKAGGVVTADAEKAFRQSLKQDKDNPKARFFLAVALAQEGETEEARRMWTDLRSSLPAASPWREVIGEAMARAGGTSEQAAAKQAAGKQASGQQAGEPAAAPGPSQADMAAAGQMAPDDRMAMIEGMVSRLDERLKENPKDADGWRRLVRSYTVLERGDEAREALRRGLDALGATSGEGRDLKAFAAELGVSATE